MKEYNWQKEKVVAFVDDECIGLEKAKINSNRKIRYASRGIIFNEENKIALLNKKNKNEYKLPGGGINEGENIIDAFIREAKEETGCQIKIIDQLGVSIEEKGLTNFMQVSFIFVGKVTEFSTCLFLTEKEKEEGAEVLWVSLDDAIELVSSSINNVKGSKYDDLYRSLFMVKRDSMILSYYKNEYLVENNCNNLTLKP